MSEFCDTPMKGFEPKSGYEATKDCTYNGEDAGPFGGFKRTSGAGGPPEVTYNNIGGKVKPEGQSDQF